MYADINLKIKYSSDSNDLLDEFYLPVLANSCKYDRAVGYFSSAILREYLTSLKDFYNNNGKFRLIISPELSHEDILVLKNASDIEIDDRYRELALKNLMRLFDDSTTSHTDLFFNLVLSGMLELKIAIVKGSAGIFHEKYGLFYENDGDKIIAINGSNNETYRGLEVNQESFNTFCSWVPGQEPYVAQHQEDFEKYWNDKSNRLRVFDVNKENFEDVFKNVSDVNVKDEFEKISQEHKESQADKLKSELLGLDFTPRPYQTEAADTLLKLKKGILKFATGSGKTKTAITYMQKIKKN